MFQLHCLHNHKKMYEENNLNVNTKYEYGQIMKHHYAVGQILLGSSGQFFLNY